MNIKNIIAGAQNITNPQDELTNQQLAMVKPADNEAYIAKLVAEGLQVLFRMENAKPEYFIITEQSILEKLKPRSTYPCGLYVSKIEDDKIKAHLIANKSKRTWTKSGREAMNMAIQQPCYLVRDPDAEVYKIYKSELVEIQPITDSEEELALAAAFGDYMISDLNHPALKGLVRGSVDSVDDVDESTSKSVLDDELAELNKAVENISIGADEKAVNEAVGKVDVIDVNVDEDITMPSDESKSFDSNGSHDLDLDIDLDLEAGFDEDLSELGDLDPEAEEKKALRELENLDLSID